jgi:carbamoyltransferase
MGHAASAYLAGPYTESAVMVLDGRGERASYLAGRASRGKFTPLVTQTLPRSLGLLYGDVTEHLGFTCSSDEYKVIAVSGYGQTTFLERLSDFVEVTDDGAFTVRPIDWACLVPRRGPSDDLGHEHANLAASVQARIEEVELALSLSQ